MEYPIINFEKGKTYRIFNNPNVYKAHVLEIVDNDMIVYKWYGKHKQWWHYQVKHREDLSFSVFMAKNRKLKKL